MKNGNNNRTPHFLFRIGSFHAAEKNLALRSYNGFSVKPLSKESRPCASFLKIFIIPTFPRLGLALVFAFQFLRAVRIFHF